MKKLVAVLAVWLFSFSQCFGYTYPSMTVRDVDGDALSVNTDGSINVAFTGGDNISFTYGVTAATGTFTQQLSVTGPGGIANTYGITAASGTFTNKLSATGPNGIVSAYGVTASSVEIVNSNYAVKISSSNTTPNSLYLGGVFTALPATGFPKFTIIVISSSSAVFISTETVVGVQSWTRVGLQH